MRSLWKDEKEGKKKKENLRKGKGHEKRIRDSRSKPIEIRRFVSLGKRGKFAIRFSSRNRDTLIIYIYEGIGEERTEQKTDETEIWNSSGKN